MPPATAPRRRCAGPRSTSPKPRSR
ncbi:hypothetical protein R2601_02733 [Salipiger bermudensis HTCC2601]|uniref:Uncharacterized protein n=1 Tax=Salipiger bermudensis (strain DSM 26914 / JCM 13377 / KCTC 12554 / HTCC2601) TaxID=314265 RepID=Q0FWU9_SALBH|nr:hypothetical protein R2601_02733 [Salipiger bermudensis HTCC2601]